MKTPAGKECKYFFGDYHRGRDHEECRLLKGNPDSPSWKPDYCRICPVPEILRQNACPNMTLDASVKKGFLGFGTTIEVHGWCSEYFLEAKDPAVGCGHCHEFKGPSILDLNEADE